MESFQNTVQAPFRQDTIEKHELWGQWNAQFFKNSQPIVLELGCGKGEYTVGLAELDPSKNYIGVDIKGSRMWKGAKYATENHLENVGFFAYQHRVDPFVFRSQRSERNLVDVSRPTNETNPQAPHV